MSCNVEFEKFNKATGQSEKYWKLDEKKQDLLDKQLSRASTKEQKTIADTLVRHHSKFEGVNENEYIDTLGKPYKRVTKFMKLLRDGYYQFDEGLYDEADYAINAEWGNIVDTVFEGIILNKKTQDIYKDISLMGSQLSISSEAVEQVRKEINNVRKLHPNSVLLPQLTLSSSMGIAGTLDLLLVEPDGSIHIYDLKTSVNPITKDGTRTDKFGNIFKTRYNKVFIKKDGSKKASKKQTHETQLNFYKAMVKEITGIEAESIAIIPGQLEIDNNSHINKVNFEGIYVHEDDVAILENIEKMTNKEEFINNLTDLTNTEFLSAVVEALRREVDNLRKQNKFSSIPKIEAIIENIEVGEGMTKISEFIEYMYDEFVTDSNSLKERFNKFINNFDIDNTSYQEALSQIDVFKSETELFRGIVSELQNIHDELKDISEEESDSNKAKLKAIVTEFNEIDRISKNKIIPLISKILSKELPQSKEYKKNLQNRIESLKKRLAKRNLGDKAKRKLKEELIKAQTKLNESDATIEEALRTGNYKDISVLSSQLNPAISVDNTIISTFAKTLKTQFEKARENLFKLEKVAAKAFNEYEKYSKISRNNVKEFNKPFYEIIGEGENAYYALVQKLDYNSFKKAMDVLYTKAKKDAIELKSKGKYTTYSVNSLTTKLAKEKAIELGYYKPRSKKDVFIENPYTKEKVVIQQGWETVRKQYKESHSEENYNKWYNRNFTTLNGKVVPKGNQLFVPNDDKFVNAKYKALGNEDSPQMKYYKFLYATYIKSQSLISDRRMMNKLPGVEKIANDRVREGDIKGWFKRYTEGLTEYLPNEEEEYGQELKKRIPHFYSTDLGLENTSLDLIGSILRYSAAAERYASQAKMEPVSKALLESVKNKGPLHESSSPLAKVLVGNKVLGEYFRKHAGNNTAAMLEALIDMHIYGKTRLKSEGPWNKIIDGLMGFASFTQIGGNPVLAVANSLAAHISTNIDAMANENFKTKTWLWAKAEYRKNEVNFWNDMMSTTKKSKIGQLTQLYDALQGEFFDEFGRKLSQSGVKKMWGSKGWFSFMHKGEHAAQTKVMMSLLKDTIVKDKNGNDISLYDAYYVDSAGNLQLQNGVQSDFLNSEVRNKLHSLNKRFNGVYNSFDKPLIKRHNLGKLVMMYRDFLAPNIRRRFKNWGVDYESGTEYEGYYNTMWRLVSQERDELLNLITGKNNNLTDHEIANAKRMAMEMTYMLLLSSIIGMLAAALDDGEDDDEAIGMKLAMQYALYWSMRASSELSFYNFGMGSINTGLLPLNPGGTLRSFRTPSPIYSILEKSGRALRHTGQLIANKDKAYYQRDMNYNTVFGNLAEKGDPKAPVSWLKLMGLNGYTFNIDNAIKILKIYD